jgi:hypothetical protein
MGHNKKKGKHNLPLLAVRTGLEPATHGVTGRYSNQLNYRTLTSNQVIKPVKALQI